MPFLSQKQSRWAFANKDKLKGKLDPKEWASKTDYDKLPEQVKKSQDYSLPSDIKPVGSYESLKKTMNENMARHASAQGNTQPAPGQQPTIPASPTPPPEKLFQVDTNIPKVTPTLPIDPMVATQSKMASALAYLLYANKLK